MGTIITNPRSIMIQVEETEVIGLDWLDRMGMG